MAERLVWDTNKFAVNLSTYLFVLAQPKQFQFVVVGDRKDAFMFQCSNEEEKNRWIDNLTEATSIHMQKLKNMEGTDDTGSIIGDGDGTIRGKRPKALRVGSLRGLSNGIYNKRMSFVGSSANLKPLVCILLASLTI